MTVLYDINLESRNKRTNGPVARRRIFCVYTTAAHSVPKRPARSLLSARIAFFFLASLSLALSLLVFLLRVWQVEKEEKRNNHNNNNNNTHGEIYGLPADRVFVLCELGPIPYYHYCHYYYPLLSVCALYLKPLGVCIELCSIRLPMLSAGIASPVEKKNLPESDLRGEKRCSSSYSLSPALWHFNIHYDGPTQCFTKAFVNFIHHLPTIAQRSSTIQRVQKTILDCLHPFRFVPFFVCVCP